MLTLLLDDVKKYHILPGTFSSGNTGTVIIIANRKKEREREREQITTNGKYKKMSINNIERPKQWSSLLQFDNKNQTDAKRRTIVMNKLEHWSRKNYFLSAGPRPTLKSCHCLNPIHVRSL